MAKKAGLQLIISLVDEATSGLQKITGSMKGLAVIGGAAVVAGMAAVGKAAWDAGVLYDEVMDGFVTKTGATGPALAQLGVDFKTVFSSIPVDAETAGAAMAILAQRTGLTEKPLQDVTRQVLEMSRLLGGDASANATGFGKVMANWKLPGDQASLTLDKIFVAAQKSGVGIDTLLGSLTTSGPVLRDMGFSLAESVALLAGFEKGGINSEKAMGAMRIAAGKFAKDGVPMREGLADTIAKIKGATSETDALALGMKVFGAKGAVDMVAAIRDGKLSTEDLIIAMGGAEGAIQRTGDATNDMPEKFQILRNKVTTLLMPLGDIMVTGLSGAMDAIGPAIDTAIAWIQKVIAPGTTLSDMWKSLQTLAQTVWPGLRDAIVGSMRAVGAIINDYVVPALGAIFTWLSVNLPPAIQAASDFWRNTLLPALTVVAAFIRDNVVPVIVEIITWLATNLPPAIQSAANFFNTVILPALQAVAGFIETKVIPVIVEIITWLATNLPPAIQAAANFFNTVILPAITAVATFVTEQLIPTFQAINAWLGEKIGPVIEIARAAFAGVLLPVLTLIWDIIVQKLIPIITELNDWLGATIIKAIDNAKAAFSELKRKLDPVLNVIRDIVSWIKTQLQPTIDGFKQFIGGIQFGNPFSGLLDTIKSVIDRIADAIRKLRELLGLTGGVGGQSSGFNVSGARFAFAGGGMSGGGAGAIGMPGNTFVFNFAAPATAYDDRRVELAVERAMLRAGVRADSRQRTR